MPTELSWYPSDSFVVYPSDSFDLGTGHNDHLDPIPLDSGIPLPVPSQGWVGVFVLTCLASPSSSLAHLAEILVPCLLGGPILGERAQTQLGWNPDSVICLVGDFPFLHEKHPEILTTSEGHSGF